MGGEDEINLIFERVVGLKIILVYLECSSGCLECSDSSNCTQCDSYNGYFSITGASSSSSSSTTSLTKCSKSCPAGYFGDFSIS